MGSRADLRHRRRAVERAATRSCGDVPERTGLQPAGVITLEDPPSTTPVAAVLRGHRAPARGRAATAPSVLLSPVESRQGSSRGAEGGGAAPARAAGTTAHRASTAAAARAPWVPPRIEAEQPGSFARRSGGLDVRRPFHRRERIRDAKTGPRGGHGSRPGTTGPADHPAATSQFGPARRSDRSAVTNWVMPDVEDLRALWEIDLELAGSDQGPIPIITTVAEKTWVWSDLHLGDRGALQAFDRPFGDVDQMNRHLLREWRRRVRSDDTIICLGDVAHPDAWRDRAPGPRRPRLPGQAGPRAREPRPEPRRVGRSGVCDAVLARVVRHRPAAGPEPLPAAPDTGGRGQPPRTPPRRCRADPATHQPRSRAHRLQPGRTHLGAGQGATATVRRTVDSRRLGERLQRATSPASSANSRNCPGAPTTW